MSCLSGLESLKPSSGDGEFLGADAQELVIPLNWGQRSLSFTNLINISILTEYVFIETGLPG